MINPAAVEEFLSSEMWATMRADLEDRMSSYEQELRGINTDVNYYLERNYKLVELEFFLELPNLILRDAQITAQNDKENGR